MTPDNKFLMVKVISFALLGVFVAISTVSYILTLLDYKSYPSNIYVNNISLAGLTETEAYYKLHNELLSETGNKLVIQFPNGQESIDIKELEIELKPHDTLKNINSKIYNDNFFNKIIIRGEKQYFTPVLAYNEQKLISKIQELKTLYDKKPVDARILINDGLIYIPHINGYLIDVKTTVDRIINTINSGELGPIEAEVINISPSVRVEDIKDIKDLISVDIVDINLSNVDNLKTAIAELNGTVIMPNGYFSLNHRVKADNDSIKIIAKGLYNVCSLAQLEILEHTNHNLLIPNFVFKNNLKEPIMIYTDIEAKRLIFKIYGCQTQTGKAIGITEEIEQIPIDVVFIEDSSLQPDETKIKQHGIEGSIIRKYRIVFFYDNIIEKSLLYEETILGQKAVILRNTNNSLGK